MSKQKKDKVLEAVVASGAEFAQRSRKKFEGGRKEHGVQYSKIDYFEEIKNEVVDLWNYIIMLEQQMKNEDLI